MQQFQTIRIHYLSLGRGLESSVEDKIIKVAQNGDWLLLENLHLVLNWITKLEEILIKLEKVDVNSKFRLWLSSMPVEEFPPSLLQRSIKISLQPPTGIKQIS